MIINGLKRCSICKENLPISNFYKNKQRSDGFLYECNKCRVKIHKKYQSENAEKVKAYHKQWRLKNAVKLREQRMKRYYQTRDQRLAKMKEAYQRIKSMIFEAYGHKCACCGEEAKEFLCIDHIRGGGCKDRKSSHPKAVYLRIRNEGFPKDKYRLLCHNCNMSIGFYGYCPHKPMPESIRANLTGRPKKDY